MWLGGLAALLIFLPNLLWNIHHGFPFVQLMHNIRTEGRDVVLTPWQYFSQQILLIHPITAPIWMAGLGALFFWKPLQPYRMLAWCYLIAFTVFVVLAGKNYYLSPIYSVLLAAGAVVIERGLERARLQWLKPFNFSYCADCGRRMACAAGGAGLSRGEIRRLHG